MTASDFIWQGVVILLLAAGGFRACRAVAGREGLGFHELLQKARHLYLVFPILVGLPCLNVFIAMRPSLQWDMPNWLQLNWAAISWGIVSGALAYMFGFCSAAADGRSRWKYAPACFGAAVILSIQFYAAWSSRPNLPPLGEERKSRDGVVLQTSPFTCVPASGANIAAILGVRTTERELVELFHTTRDGTFPAQALRGMAKIGISGRKVDVPDADLRVVKPPAMLFVLGDTHAMVYAGMTNGVFEIWNPSTGKWYVSERRIHQLWTGHALEFQRAANGG